jgi:hypothetical protein
MAAQAILTAKRKALGLAKPTGEDPGITPQPSGP